MSKPLKIVFAGTPCFSAQILANLIASQYEVIAVYTQPDRRAGRGKKLSVSSVKQQAIDHNIDVYQPVNFSEASTVQSLADLNADLMVVVAYGILLPQEVLDTPRLGCINVHASILPRWRGAAPIERAVLEGDKISGITIMQMDKGLDTGDILHICKVIIDESMTSADLHDKLIPAGIEALNATLAAIDTGSLRPVKQNDLNASYAVKLQKSEGIIDWSLSAESISRKIRGLTPRPVAFSTLDNLVIRIWQSSHKPPVNDPNQFNQALLGTIASVNKNGICVYCDQGSLLYIESLQLPGGKQLTAQQVLTSRKSLFYIGNQFSLTKESC